MKSIKKQVGKCILNECIRTGFNRIENTELADYENCRNCIFLKDKEIMKEAKEFVNNCVKQYNITENIEDLLYDSFLYGAKNKFLLLRRKFVNGFINIHVCLNEVL